jgi:hypothetical protein
MSVELACRGFQDVGSGETAGRNTPSFVFEEECSLRLRTCQAELARVAGSPPCGLVLAQGTESVSDASFVEPLNFPRGSQAYGIEPFRTHKLDGTGAVFADIGNKTEGVSSGNVKFTCPLAKDDLIVGE